MNASMSLVRAIHLASCMLLVGGIVFRLFVAQPVFTAVKKDTRLAVFDSLDRRLRTLTISSIVVSFVSWCIWLWLVAARLSGTDLILASRPKILSLLLRQTEFGLLWEMRLAIMVGFVALLGVRKQWAGLVRLLFAMALLAALSLAGHAGASVSAAHGILIANDAFHLIAAGIWPAGLASFAIFLTQALQAMQPGEIEAAALVTQRFSLVSLVTVGILAITGSINGYFLIGTFHTLVATVYGRLLLLKLGIFAAMVTIGAFNLLSLKPRVVGAVKSASQETSWSLLHCLRRNILIELLLGAFLMIVIGLLGVTPPAAHAKIASGYAALTTR
jgi:copper resistance protein D